ncbi:SDR family NAD(P)-dependent oxidoreductase [Neoroseomonas oryzicola]|uniref:SDR family NAD(P)-dependent oxidoreductase n=1 Tax=Neoroseomonas oryzicola TaxID=535904 RepID=A0A9X9WDQ3_9PROT|nr:SDR family NAD(P)-dependent oxidoreductase [Neoroseomonas oryzicola]MBR0658463.1 SDR family NAD(P)-dependent oxidoreductase [Neoroseomonas oryzicola]NKE17652.1 SDR family NAD(P)-dependent oxidoreductase [Neoroseomonas oryzicola]
MPKALIIGAGDGLSASLARLLAREGYAVALAARNVAKLDALVSETEAVAHACDAASEADIARLFDAEGDAEVVVYNPSFRTRGPIADLVPADVQKSLQVCAFGAFLAAQQAARRMLPRRAGTILLTGASAGVKGYPQSAPFAMGKFALRGLAQSLARELHPQGVHVAHIVIDGGIRSARRPETGDDTLLDPDAIAETYLQLIRQPRSAWSWEIEVRPWVEKF